MQMSLFLRNYPVIVHLSDRYLAAVSTILGFAHPDFVWD